MSRPGLVTVAVVALVAGCASEPVEAVSEFDVFVAPYRDAAVSAGASAHQLELLDDALAADETSFAAYSEAVNDALACMDAGGVAHSDTEAEDSRGYPSLDFSYEGGPGGNAVAEACITTHLDFVDSVYQLQPSAIGAREAAFEDALPELTACLRDDGYDVASDAGPDEVRAALDLMVTDTDRIEAEPHWNPAHCLIDAGVGGY